MKAILLSAGQGSRLKPLTDKKPKCLVEINQKSILERQIESLQKSGVKDVVVIIGYMAEKVKEKLKKYKKINIKFVFDKNYQIANNMHGLMLAEEEIKDGFLLMNGDVVLDTEIIADLIKCRHKNAFPIEQDKYLEEAMKVIIKDGLVRNIRKDIKKEEASGCSIDVYKFSEEGAKVLFEEINYIIGEQKKLNEWTEVAIRNILHKIEIYPLYINGKKWMDIDTLDDLKIAEIIFK